MLFRGLSICPSTRLSSVACAFVLGANGRTRVCRMGNKYLDKVPFGNHAHTLEFFVASQFALGSITLTADDIFPLFCNSDMGFLDSAFELLKASLETAIAGTPLLTACGHRVATSPTPSITGWSCVTAGGSRRAQ